MDIHAGYSGKMEGLQRHLRAWLSNTLCPHGPHSCAGLNTRAHKLVYARGKKPLQLGSSNSLNLVENCSTDE